MSGNIEKVASIDPSKVIETIQPDKSQLVVISEIEQGLSEMEAKYSTMPDVTNSDGMKDAKVRQMVLGGAIKKGDDARVAYTKPLYDEKKKVDTAWNKGIEPRLRAMKDPLDKLIKEEQGRIAREEKERVMAEESRQDAIRLRIQTIESLPATLLEVEDAEKFIADHESLQYGEFMEFREDARKTTEKSLALAHERLATLLEKQQEAQRLEDQRIEQAAQQKLIDDANAERAAEDKKRADEQAAFEKQKEDFEAQQLADKQRKDGEEKARVANIEKAIEVIASEVDGVHSVEMCELAVVRLGMLKPADYQEFADTAEKAIAASIEAVNAKRVELTEQEQATKALEEKKIEDARLLGIEQQKKHDEQVKTNQEAAAEVARAEAEKLAAMKPDADKLRAWIDTIPELPEMETEEGRQVVKTILAELLDMGVAISDLKLACDESQAA